MPELEEPLNSTGLSEPASGSSGADDNADQPMAADRELLALASATGVVADGLAEKIQAFIVDGKPLGFGAEVSGEHRRRLLGREIAHRRVSMKLSRGEVEELSRVGARQLHQIELADRVPSAAQMEYLDDALNYGGRLIELYHALNLAKSARSDFARKIQTARAAKGFTLRRLAKAVDVAPLELIAWEQGSHLPTRANWPDVRRIDAVLECDGALMDVLHAAHAAKAAAGKRGQRAGRKGPRRYWFHQEQWGSADHQHWVTVAVRRRPNRLTAGGRRTSRRSGREIRQVGTGQMSSRINRG
ncbi:helix-turn-helix transcriptional regulator [Catellatospora sp. NPDC049133]|uniref:helix-turn-helix domain-containing protein n=1 Tax=Catellatospora sp. NPDC049133 TaxID=3155499 RepID=UPI003402384E